MYSAQTIFSFVCVSDCSISNLLSLLMPVANCYLSSECLRLDCCVDIAEINKRLDVQFMFDPCNFKYTIGIETFTFENNIFDTNLELEQIFSLHGIVTIRQVYFSKLYFFKSNIRLLKTSFFLLLFTALMSLKPT